MKKLLIQFAMLATSGAVAGIIVAKVMKTDKDDA
jgi:hypothetical protein